MSTDATASVDGEHADRRSSSLASATRVTGAMTLLSRIAGLVRDVLVVRIFGETAIGSAFAAAFAIPNLFRRLFGEGALSAAFLPEYTRTHQQSPADADRYASLVVFWLAVVTGVLTAVIEAALVVVLLMTPADNAERVLSIKLIMVMLPFMPLICVTAILGGMLQTHGRFGLSASGPVILNAVIIITGLYHLFTGAQGKEGAAYLLGVATVLSGLMQAVYFARGLRPHVGWTRDVAPALARGRETLRRFFPVMLGLGTLQLSSFMDTIVAMWPIWVGPTFAGAAYPLDQSSNVILASSQRLYQFPLGVFGIAVATAAFPMLSRAAHDGGHFADVLRRALRLSFFIGLPASIGLVVVREPAAHALYGGGSRGFTPEGLARSAAVILGFAPAIWAYSLNHVLTRAFYARGDTRTPMQVAIGAVGLNLVLNFTLIWWLREAGLAWSTTISATAQCVALLLLARTRLGVSALDRPTIAAFVRIVVCGVLMGAAAWGAMRVVGPSLPSGWTRAAILTMIATAVGVAAFLGVSSLAKVRELRWLLSRSVAEKPNAH